MTPEPLSSFKAFLSHRYKSPQVNEYFYDIFSRFGEVQFEVDKGTIATNVTRLERLVRDADAFIGLYPLPSEESARPDRSEALKASRYFRLELDLAVRSGKPSIVFVDARYGNVITVPPPATECRFDHQAILSASASPKEALYLQAFESFLERVSASVRLEIARTRSYRDRNRVGILLPSRADAETGYTGSQFDMIAEMIRAMSQEPVRLPEQPVLDGTFFRQVEELDWLVADIGEASCRNGVVPYLHGRFVPMMRLLRVPAPDASVSSPFERSLFGAHEVGYPKDILRWHDDASLESEFNERLATLYEPRRRINTREEARTYFAGAALRKEPVFVSYSGEDRDLAETFNQALRKRFQVVFDYRDKGESIVPGRSWIEEIFERLAASSIAVPLLSASYFASGNCKHESREIMALRDAGKMTVIPIKLRDGDLDMSPWIRDVQYLRLWDYGDPDKAVEALIRAFDKSREIDTRSP